MVIRHVGHAEFEITLEEGIRISRIQRERYRIRNAQQR